MLIIVSVLAGGCSGGSDNTLGGATGTGGDTGDTGGNQAGGDTAAPAATLTVTTSTQSIAADGSESATITAFVRDADNNLVAGVPVEFTASSGGISGSPAVTDDSGQATATLVTAGDNSLRTITVTAAAGSLQAQVNVQVVASSSASSVQMGNGSGATFQAGIIGISNSDVSAGGATSLTVSLVQSGGTLYTGAATINFNSPCVANGLAEIRQNGAPVTAVTTQTGIATVTYAAVGCSGDDVITASSTIDNESLSATGTVTVAAAAVGSIEFVSATPTNIALQGTGDATRPESSTVVFRVKDASNGPVQGATVAFTLNTAVGGIALSTTSETSDNQGFVQTVVNAGTVATSVKVTATVTSASQPISTQSSQLTVTTGIPTDDSFSLAVGCFNIEGWEYDGVTTEVTARLGDRFQNPVPDGTAITFTAEGGNIQSQCTTETTDIEGGVCSVNFRSSNPRPADGRVTILSKAIGEESFVDANGNGAFDDSETFSDIPEPFRDDNEDGDYDAGEDFFDFNNNQSRDVEDSNFNGVLCNDPLRCSGAPSTGIAESNLIILSGSAAVITDDAGLPPPSSVTMGTDSAMSFAFWIRDVNGNVMPGETTVTLSASGGGLTVTQPASYAIPCSAIAPDVQFPGITLFPFTITSSDAPGTGVVTLTVETPRGLLSTHQITVDVS
ncbi:MAG TPA: Ig-like domain-containing protein [Gammaproteobacteria bacterium]